MAGAAALGGRSGMGNKTRILLAAVIVQFALLLPIAINPYLRANYEFTLAHYRAKIIRPDRVFIGDSMTAGGGDFGRFGTINLASNGLHTKQIAGMLKTAQAYNPREIYVMAGANDLLDNTEPAAMRAAWQTILADTRVVVTLLPHTRKAARNRQVDALNAMVEHMAREAGRRVVTIPGLTQHDGTIQPRYTVDGMHLAPPAYVIWRAQIG